MNRNQLLNIIDNDLLDHLYGYCYRRTSDSHEAEELCSDILFALVRAGNTEGELQNPVAFIWRVAHNVYAEHSEKKRIRTERGFMGDPDELLCRVADEDITEEQAEDRENLGRILREISFLSVIYRNVTVDYYLEGLSTAAIAKKHGIAEVTVRQRLFSARETIRKGVTKMEKTMQKPLALENLNLNIWGSGNPMGNDPREVAERQLSQHIVWMCKPKAVTAREVSDTLHLPMLYVEEELAIQCRGRNGKYGLLRKLDNDRYALNFVLLDEKEIDEIQRIYISRLPAICDGITKYVEEHRDDLLALPYLNKEKDLNLILWSQVKQFANTLENNIANALGEHMKDIAEPDRPFSVYGWKERTPESNYGSGQDGISAEDLCGYSSVDVVNIYNSYIKAHFRCGHNIALDKKLQLAIRAIDGLALSELSEGEKEAAAKAIECGYLLRDGDTLYTKIITYRKQDANTVRRIPADVIMSIREAWEGIADEIATFARKNLPAHLLGEYRYVNELASLPVFTKLVETLMGRGLLTLPENQLGAEGCWMVVKK